MSGADAGRPAPHVTLKLLRRMAGEPFFGRGEAYLAGGAVRSLRKDGNGVKAAVQGTRSYRVRLWFEDGELGHDCTCPMGWEGYFCKHCVAVGLAWHAEGENCQDGSAAENPSAVTAESVRDHLMGLEKETLVSMLLDMADEDERLHWKLTIRAAHGSQETPNTSAWMRAFDGALASDDLVSYHEAYDYAAGIGEVVGALEDLLREGHAESAIELAEHGLEGLEEALEYVDDSDGWMGGLLSRLQDVHLDACLRARPDPVELAERLFEWEMTSPFDVFYGAAATYAEVLGEKGLAAYRRLAEADWAKVQALGPGEKDPCEYGRRFRITSIMETLAHNADDLDALVTVKSRDLSKPYGFLQIAALYNDVGDPDTALDWAERGLRAFPDEQRDPRLRAFVADAYHDRVRHDEAMALIWETFADGPRLETYCELEKHGRRSEQWPAWRDKALDLIRARIGDGEAAPANPRAWPVPAGRDHSCLVEIFLHEGDVDAAWREAEMGGCSRGLWLKLAKCREKSHPADAVRIYEDHIAALLRNTGNRVYEETVRTLEKIRKVLADYGQDAEFRSLLTEIRATHRRKRNLMTMLDARGW